MLHESWVAAGDDDQLALFSPEGVLPQAAAPLTGQDLMRGLLDRAQVRVAEAHLDQPLPAGGQFVPALAVAEDAAALAGCAPKTVRGGAVARLDDETDRERLERLYLDDRVTLFDYEPRALDALAALAGLLVFDPDQTTAGGYVKAVPAADPTVRPAFAEVLRRGAPAPWRVSDLPAGLRDRVVRLTGVRLSERNHVVPAEHGAMRALDAYEGPRHLADQGEPARWPWWAALGAAAIGLLVFLWLRAGL